MSSVYEKIESIVEFSGNMNSLRNFGKAVTQDQKDEFKSMDLGKAGMGLVSTILSTFDALKDLNTGVDIASLTLTWNKVAILWTRDMNDLEREGELSSTVQLELLSAILETVKTCADLNGYKNQAVDSGENAKKYVISDYRKVTSFDRTDSLQDLLRTSNQYFVKEVMAPTVNQELHLLINSMATFDSASNEANFMVTDDSSLTRPLLTSSY